MKVLQISAYFYPSYRGTELTVAELSRGLAALGHDVDVLTVNTEGAPAEEMWLGRVKVRRCAPLARYRRGVISVELLGRLMRARDYDIYHVHIPFHSGLEFAALASRVNGIPLVANHHGEAPKFSLVHGIIDGAYRRLYRGLCLRQVSKLIFFTRSYPDSLGLSTTVQEKVAVIRPAVDTVRFSPDNDGSQLRGKYGFAPADPVVLCVTGLMPGDERRGIHYLIAAMKKVRNEFPRARLVVVGEGKLRPVLNKSAVELLGDGGALFVGRVTGDELALHYAMCDLFAFPTTYEPFGFVVQEAMASGRPVVVSDIPGVGEMVVHGKTGLKPPPRDHVALAEAIISLLRDDKLRQHMGRNARESLEGRTWSDVVKEVEHVYNEVLMGHNQKVKGDWRG